VTTNDPFQGFIFMLSPPYLIVSQTHPQPQHRQDTHR